MSNIWGFLLQTLSVSFVAGLLLMIKWLMADKLSPRWQYGVWSILALRVVIPVSITRYILIPIPLWLETLKAMAERSLASVYTAVYTPVELLHVLPVFRVGPKSITDWLFVIYAAGIGLSLLWYLVSYVRLRHLLRGGAPVSSQLQSKIDGVCQKYGLKSCPAVTVDGLPSAFVCGGLRPILVVPAELDEKVVLHELIHLKHRDALQSIGWCVLRALHWCNPFMHYVFNRIENDMESLCDQRVLERLEGEERREYGNILLNMANERYARAPGTSSISNGGKNISRRIAAIVRFKKYPQGMALVSVCIAITLIAPTIVGNASAFHGRRYTPNGLDELEPALATARIQRCTTVAGALDTYAKGILTENGIYIATASSLSKHEALAAEMGHNVENEVGVAYHLGREEELKNIDSSKGYRIFNLRQEADGSYHGILAFSVFTLFDEQGLPMTVDAESMFVQGGTALVPVSVRLEDAWVVEKSGDIMFSEQSLDFVDFKPEESGLAYLSLATATGKTGTVTIGTITDYEVNNEAPEKGWNFFGNTSFDVSPKVDAIFYQGNIMVDATYSCLDNATGTMPQSYAGLRIAELDSLDAEADFSNIDMGMNSNGSSSDGTHWGSNQVSANWGGTLRAGGGSGYYDLGDDIILPPSAYQVQIFWDGDMVEELTLDGGLE